MKNTMKYFLSAAFMASMLVIGSCDDDDALPPIDGYNSSDEVASTNLLAHWTFDDTNAERLSGTAPSNTYGTVGFTTGQIGSALKLTKGVLVYPPITAINSANALNNFTVSLWVNVKGNKGTADAGFTSFFSLAPSGVTDVWGDIHAAAETSHHLPGSDSLKLKNLLNTHPVGGGNSLQDNVATTNGDKGKVFKGAGRWAHYVMTWNATTHQFKLYGDATSVGGYDDRGTTGVLIMAVPVKAIFGSLPSADIGFAGAGAQQGWNPWANASIDDVRVFNTVLTDAEITALFNLGTAGR
jgi:hypothetical protein